MVVGAEERLDDELALVGRAQALLVHVGLQQHPKVLELRRRAIHLLSHGVLLGPIVAHRRRSARRRSARRVALEPFDCASMVARQRVEYEADSWGPSPPRRATCRRRTRRIRVDPGRAAAHRARSSPQRARGRARRGDQRRPALRAAGAGQAERIVAERARRPDAHRPELGFGGRAVGWPTEARRAAGRRRSTHAASS